MTVLEGDYFALKVDGQRYDDSKVASFLDQFKNRTHVNIRCANLRFLKQISEHLPLLNSLTLTELPNEKQYRLNYDGGDIRFPLVDSLEIRNDGENGNVNPEGLVFNEHFQTLVIHSARQNSINWIQKFNIYSKTIEILHLYIDDLTKEQFQAIPTVFPKATTVHIGQREGVTQQTEFNADDVNKLLESSTEIVAAYLDLKITKDEVQKLKNKYQKPWDFSVWYEVENGLANIGLLDRSRLDRLNYN